MSTHPTFTTWYFLVIVFQQSCYLLLVQLTIQIVSYLPNNFTLVLYGMKYNKGMGIMHVIKYNS